MNAAEIASRLKDAKRTSKGWNSCCPSHEDGNASLSISEGHDGKVLLHCHAGCTHTAIVSALGLKENDLFPPKPEREQAPRLVKTYDYTDASGTLLYQVCRYEPKTFRQRRPDPSAPGKWIWDMAGQERVLYRLPDVLAAISKGNAVFVVEGEKDADALAKLGLCATCNSGGAGKWLPAYTETLTGAKVFIIPDKDTPGRKHAALVRDALTDKAQSVQVVELPDREGHHVKDISDWLSAGGTAEELLQIVKDAPKWTPPTEATTTTPADDTQGEPEPWDPPMLFDGAINLPSFPVDVLPGVFGAFVNDVALSKQIDASLPGSLVLSAVAIAAAKRFKVYIGQSHSEPLNIFTLSLMEPGSRKSDTFRACMTPIEDYEIELCKEAKPEIFVATERFAIEESRLTELRKRAGKTDDMQERRELTLEAEEIATNRTDIPPQPRLIVGDVSPEHLASLLCSNGGRMAVADAEGGLVFAIMGGRYSKNGAPNMEVFLKGHAGDAIRVDRTGRPSEFAQSAALTCCLTAQPAILRDLESRDAMRGRGLLARFLFTIPSGLIGSRSYGNKPMNPVLVSEYGLRLRDLLKVQPVDPENTEATHRLNLAGDSLEIWRTYHDQIEKAMAPDGELCHMTDFGSKLAGAVARMSGLLHLMKHGANPPQDIEPETVAGAWALGLFYLEHTKAAFSEMGSTGDVGLAKRVYSWISQHRYRRFTLGKLFDTLRRGEGLEKSKDLLPALEMLEDRNIVRKESHPSADKPGPGRKPLGAWEVNPLIVSGIVI